jgi:protein TonB
MFEDSTFETMGTIHTRSRGWMMATLALNSSTLLALAMNPIMHPEMLPQITNAIRMIEPPMEQQRSVVRMVPAQSERTETLSAPIMDRPPISSRSRISDVGNDPGPIGPIDLGGNISATESADSPFGGHGTQPIVRPAAPAAARHVSSGVMEGMLIHKVVPAYPAIAAAVRASGTVVLQATISRTGTIENLRAMEGPAMLRQAALDAVKQWRYKPYMLNGQPVEVDTWVDVQFKLE